MDRNDGKQLFFLVLDGLGWTDLIRHLPQLPALAAMAQRGTAAPLNPGPTLPGLGMATQLITGLPLTEHGVILPNEAWAGGVRPTGAASWRRTPIWTRLATAGVRAASVNWPASAPATAWEPANVIDDTFAVTDGRDWLDWPLPPFAVPSAYRERLRDLRMHPVDVDAMMLLPLIPALASIDQLRDPRVAQLATAVARLSTEHAAIMAMVADHDAVFAWHGWLGWLMGAAIDAAPPYDRVLDAGRALVDALVARMVAVLPPAATFVVVGLAGNQPGVVLGTGPGITAAGRLSAIGLADVVPTLLARLGFSDPALPGRARLGGTGTASLPVDEARPTPTPPHAQDLARVTVFGFTPPIARSDHGLLHDLAVAEALLATDPAAAGAKADDILRHVPQSPRALGIRALACVAAGDSAPLSDLADALAIADPDHPWLPLIRAAWHVLRGERAAAEPLVRAAEVGGPLERTRAAALWLMLDRPKEAERLYSALVEAAPGDAQAQAGLAMALAPRPAEAELAWRRAAALLPDDARIASAHAKARRRVGLT